MNRQFRRVSEKASQNSSFYANQKGSRFRPSDLVPITLFQKGLENANSKGSLLCQSGRVSKTLQPNEFLSRLFCYLSSFYAKFANLEGSRKKLSVGVPITPRKGPRFAKTEGSPKREPQKTPSSPVLKSLENANLKVSLFRQFGRVSKAPIRKGFSYANRKGFLLRHSRRVSKTPILKGYYFADPEGPQKCQKGRFPIMQIGKSPYCAHPNVSRKYQSERVHFTPIGSGP